MCIYIYKVYILAKFKIFFLEAYFYYVKIKMILKTLYMINKPHRVVTLKCLYQDFI